MNTTLRDNGVCKDKTLENPMQLIMVYNHGNALTFSVDKPNKKRTHTHLKKIKNEENNR